MAITSFALNGIFDLTFLPKLGFDLNPSSYLLIKLPGYDHGFLPLENTVMCFIDQIHTPCT
jgi:hypothetical protein